MVPLAPGFRVQWRNSNVNADLCLAVGGVLHKQEGLKHNGTGIDHKENHPPSSSAVILVGAGDIASCDDLRGAEAKAELIDNIPGTVFASRRFLNSECEDVGGCETGSQQKQWLPKS
jgi:hypothetical protein